MKTVCIDMGHSMNTAGKQTPPYVDGLVIKEAQQNYPIGFLVKDILKYNGVNVVVTNSDISYDMSLHDRVAVEKSVDADCFVSFHKNAGPKYEWSAPNGTETYCYKFGANGEKLARYVQNEVIDETDDYNRGIKEANFYVLKYTKSPAILCELGFMTNKGDAADMLNKTSQKRYAEAVAKGILKYLEIEYKEEPCQDYVDEAIKEALYNNLSSLVGRLEGITEDLNLLIDSI